MLFVFCKPPPSNVGDERSSHFCPAVNNWEEKKVFFNRKNQKQEVDHWHLVDIYVGCIFENVSWGRSSQKKKNLIQWQATMAIFSHWPVLPSVWQMMSVSPYICTDSHGPQRMGLTSQQLLDRSQSQNFIQTSQTSSTMRLTFVFLR